MFIHNDFLLQTPTAVRLYHGFVAGLPIIDFHNHLSPREIADDILYRNLTHVWLDGDHYKWRAMRTAGVDERLITGDASDRDKFMAWASTVPKTLKNPLYHWTHLELKCYFGIDELLDEKSAPRIWDQANELLQTYEFSTRGLLRHKNVQIVCTTDDAIDSLEFHQKLKDSGVSDLKMFPTFRPDKAMNVEAPASFKIYVGKLEAASGIHISGYKSFMDALRQRHDHFDALGCRASDHGIEEPYSESFTSSDVERIFSLVMTGQTPDLADQRVFKSAMMHEFAVMDHEKGWVCQLHIGAMRNNNSRRMLELGPDTGYDSIGDAPIAKPLIKFLDRLDQSRSLPKTILYTMNSSHNEVLSSLIGTFMGDGIPGKIQHGPAWWFHDQKEGMEQQLQTLSNMNLLSQFVGMVTDSRSFLSFPRHEYFRRILCNMLGSDVENGIIPNDEKLLGDLIETICHKNAMRYFSYR